MKKSVLITIVAVAVLAIAGFFVLQSEPQTTADEHDHAAHAGEAGDDHGAEAATAGDEHGEEGHTEEGHEGHDHAESRRPVGIVRCGKRAARASREPSCQDQGRR